MPRPRASAMIPSHATAQRTAAGRFIRRSFRLAAAQRHSASRPSPANASSAPRPRPGSRPMRRCGSASRPRPRAATARPAVPAQARHGGSRAASPSAARPGKGTARRPGRRTAHRRLSVLPARRSAPRGDAQARRRFIAGRTTEAPARRRRAAAEPGPRPSQSPTARSARR